MLCCSISCPTTEEDPHTSSRTQLVETGESRDASESQDKGFDKRRLSKLLDSTAVTAVSMTCLAFALIGASVVVLLDVPDDPSNVIMDVIMLVVMVFFILEIALTSFAKPHTYFLSLFFYLDVMGSASLVFEVSFLLGDAGKISTTGDHGMTTVILRAARMARVSARAGKLLKSFGVNNTKQLGARLMRVVSTRVAILTIALVLVIPALQMGTYPVDDFSGSSWIFKLERDYSRAYHALKTEDSPDTTSILESSVEDMVAFYEDFDYYPYKIVGYSAQIVVDGRHVTIPGEAIVSGKAPVRRQNIVRHEVESCQLARPHCEDDKKAAVFFNFTRTNQYFVAMQLAVICFIVGCMCLASFDLSRSLNVICVQPINEMIETTGSVLRFFKNEADEDEHEHTADDRSGVDETVKLRALLEKMTRLVSVMFEREGNLEDAEMYALSTESQGVLMEVLRRRSTKKSSHATYTVGSRISTMSMRMSERSVASSCLEGLSMERDEIFSWNLDLLSMNTNQLQNVAMYIMFDSPIGSVTGRTYCSDDKRFRRFVDKVSAAYLDNPYHNFAHACDVLATCTRVMTQLQWEAWLIDTDAYAMLISAFCHDIGHGGKTNPYLVETADPLALLYNDKSPLENMHCAKMFEIVSDPKVNVFDSLDTASFKDVRQVCIAAILHTDNALHFEMVKEFQAKYEVVSGLCQAQARCPDDLQDEYVNDVLTEHARFWLKSLVHFADISNPLKTFEMYQKWSTRVIDEFFAQGDKEKELGLPVGMLNDRDKVNRPGAEHGFIVFLVAPLCIGAARIFPMLAPLAVKMAENTQQWLNLWIDQAKPSPEDISKREVDVKKIRDQVEAIQNPEASVADKGEFYSLGSSIGIYTLARQHARTSVF